MNNNFNVHSSESRSAQVGVVFNKAFVAVGALESHLELAELFGGGGSTQEAENGVGEPLRVAATEARLGEDEHEFAGADGGGGTRGGGEQALEVVETERVLAARVARQEVGSPLESRATTFDATAAFVSRRRQRQRLVDRVAQVDFVESREKSAQRRVDAVRDQVLGLEHVRGERAQVDGARPNHTQQVVEVGLRVEFNAE